LNEVWKDGLTELSGGQCAMLALSLILALLRFKPAPLYILDEVDAALDASNAQNIGKMLATHFHSSQFIIVSHKKEMWSNANVLFQVRCVDDVSSVTRIAGVSSRDREADIVAMRRSSDDTTTSTTDSTITSESSPAAKASVTTKKGKKRDHGKSEEERDHKKSRR